MYQYFNKIKIHFSPYRFLQIDDPSVIKEAKVKVRGSLDVSNSKVFYEYIPVIINSKEIGPEIIRSRRAFGGYVKIGNAPPTPVVVSPNGRQFYKDLDLARLGLDSASEVAIEDIVNRLKDLIDKQLLFVPPVLYCEWVIAEIHKAASKASMFQDKELGSIWKFGNGVYEAQEYLQTFERIKSHPFVTVGARQIPLKIDNIIGLLKYLIANSIFIPNSVLPQINSSNESSGDRLTPPTIFSV